jgi:hypothetical protein
MRRPSFVPVLVMFFFAASLHAQCGVERWSVKTGTDPQASSVNLSSYISSTIYNFQQSTRPASLPANGRVAPRETTQYQVSGTLTKYKRETDSDYHLVIQDGSGRTMIIEIPSPNCVGSGPFVSGIRNARAQFDAKLTATSSFKTVTAPVTIKGVGFWDFLHGQTGVAPNGIEVHPVLNIAFTGPITADEPGTVSAATIPPVEMPADMVEDNDGGRAHVFRGGEPTADVLFHGGPVIEQPRLRVIFAGSRWTASERFDILNAARSLSSDARFASLERYGVRTTGMPVEARFERSFEANNDLDVQRFLATAVENGLQHVDENVINIIVVHPDTALAVGTTTDWTSYHSLFHPTELGMPYVVVRAGDDIRESMFASVARAIINPDGSGWF